MRIVFRVLAVTSSLVLYGHAAFVKRPYVQNLTDTSIVVRWEISSSQTGKVQYGLTTGYGLEASGANPATSHELLLADLIRDTVYYYRAISGSDTSANAKFHTPVTPAKPFRFMAYGDDRSDSASHQSVINQMSLVSPSPGLMLNVGDLTATGSATDYQTFFNVERGLMNHIPLFPVLGNHDISNMANWYASFALPNGERWYSLRYGNSAFICLDVYSTYTPGSTEYNWLVSEFLADSADPSIRHIFVVIHEPPYTTNNGHASNTTIRQYLCPLFERFHVPIAFQGHNHCYEHSLVNGVHYIITGGGGAPLYSSWGAAQPWTVYREATFEFVLVSVSGDTISCKGIKPGGVVFDSFAVITPPGAVREGDAIPVQPELGLTATPNPLADLTRISFTLRESGPTTLTLHDAAGNLRASLVDRILPAGEHDISWGSEALPNGNYLLILKTPKATSSMRLVIRR
jgi:Icc-related predicted phosphoesterase